MLEARATRRSLILFPLINIFYWSALYLYTPTLSTYATAQGISAQMVGLIVGGFGLTQVIFRLPFGVASDRVRRRKVFVCAGMLFAALSAWMAAAFSSAAGLFFARCVAGLGASAWVNCTVLFPSYYPPGQIDRAVSRLNAYSSISCVISSLLGGWLAGRLGQVATGYVAALFGLVALLLSLGIADHRPAEMQPLRRHDIAQVLRSGSLWRFGAIALTFHFVWTGTTSCFTPLVAQQFSPTEMQLGYLSSCGHLGIFVASAVIGAYILPRVSMEKVFFFGLLTLGMCMVLTVNVTRYWMLLAVQILQGLIGYSVFLGALIRSMQAVSDAHSGIAIGLVQALYAAGQFLGPLAMGQLVGRISLQMAYYLICLLCMLMAFLARHWMRKYDVVQAQCI